MDAAYLTYTGERFASPSWRRWHAPARHVQGDFVRSACFGDPVNDSRPAVPDSVPLENRCRNDGCRDIWASVGSNLDGGTPDA